MCQGDGDGSYVTNLAGDKVTLPEGATDASMAPYHVARSTPFVRERTAKALVHLDTLEIEADIEHTRFPVPEDEQHESTDDFPGLVRAADLIGQLADINYLRKQAALYNEFRETGMSDKLKYNSVADLRANYPDFLLEDGPTLYRRCLALPSRHSRGPTMDCQSLCKRVLDGA